jgi:hypothetical protein
MWLESMLLLVNISGHNKNKWGLYLLFEAQCERFVTVSRRTNKLECNDIYQYILLREF